MAERIRVVPTRFGTSDWRAEFIDNGKYICDIRFDISSMLNGSRYYVLQDGVVAKEGSFNFGVWDYDAVRDVLAQIVRRMYAGASVEVEMPRPRGRAAGG
ncbi:MAG TPA: hypothetical protein VJN18_11360 [Polyangiaceae bacterium]|nr:hypothetical protein [Polyangiaceae bacterium]